MKNLHNRLSNGHWLLCPLLEIMKKSRHQGSGWHTPTPRGFFLLLSPWGVSSLFLLFIHLLNTSASVPMGTFVYGWKEEMNKWQHLLRRALGKTKHESWHIGLEDSVVRQWTVSAEFSSRSSHNTHGTNMGKKEKSERSLPSFFESTVSNICYSLKIYILLLLEVNKLILHIIITLGQAWKTISSPVPALGDWQ